MLIYEAVVGGTRKLLGTDGAPNPSTDTEVLVNDATFDFTAGKYFYMAPGGIKDSSGNEVVVSWKGEQIIPPTWADAGEVDEDYDEPDELIDDNDTPDDDSDDKLIKVWTKDELEAETKATIAQMAEVLGYDGIDTSMSKSAMIEAFLDAQDDDPRKPNA